MYQALCSVVVQSTKLKKLTIADHAYGAVTDTKWRWLVYALFSKASTTSVNIMNARTTALLPIREPVDVASVVNAQYPHTQLLDDSSPVHDVDLGVVHLAKDTAIQFSSDPQDRITLDEESVFEIIRDDPSAAIWTW
ncbi:hypothetical protein Poli38472_011179 [Pythium oligandrum]|uniref:Uncharacterized protein n=1 Tax=Pythium oligandrum TaxID=41045 RepID=A0A8K1FNP9_PYTOL|nr:hypothetical protein Poli38472_011179 [Pythium oligandrum]|eukprot:TMW67559.1 hypothetical protein Poli38472_011179 [Pythium oligandrum]